MGSNENCSLIHLQRLRIWCVRRLRNVWNDLRSGMILSGSIPSKHKHSGAIETTNSEYEVLEKIFSGQITRQSVLVDIGCGKGRVINYWLQRGLTNRIYGIELDRNIAARTAKRFSKHSNVSILTGDAVGHIPPDGTIFYMYNPFDARNVMRLEKRLRDLFSHKGGIVIFYYDCAHVDVFKNKHWNVEVKDIGSHPLLPFDMLAIIRVSAYLSGCETSLACATTWSAGGNASESGGL